MAYSSLFAIPFIISLLLPAYKHFYMDSDSFWLSKGFVYSIIFLTSLLNGLGEGVSQPASGTYISDCAVESNKGFYFAFFWAYYMGSQIFGNLIAAFVLGNLDQRYYVLIMVGLTFIACFMFFFLKAPIVQHENIRKENLDEQTKAVRSMNNQSLRSGANPQQINSLGDSVRSMWKLTCDRRFMYLIP